MSWRLWYRQTSLMGTSPPQKQSSLITETMVEAPQSPVASLKEIISTFGSSEDQLLPIKSLHNQQQQTEQAEVETPAPSFQEKPTGRLQGKFFIPSDSESSDSESEETKRPVYRTRYRRRRPSRPETPRTSDWDSDYRCSDSSSSTASSTLASPTDLPEPPSSYFAKKPQPALPCPQRSLLSSMLANNPTQEPPKFLRRSKAPVYQDLNQLADRHLPQQDSCLSESLRRNLIRENSASGCSSKLHQPRVVDSNTLALGWSDLSSFEGGGW